MRKIGWFVAIVIGVGVVAGCGGSLQTTAQTNQVNQASTYKCVSYNTNERCRFN